MTSIGLCTNFVSFTPYSYKIGSIKILIHRSYELSSSWTSFNEDISNVKLFLMRYMFPSHLIDKQVKCFLHNKFLLLKMAICFRVKSVYQVL